MTSRIEPEGPAESVTPLERERCRQGLSRRRLARMARVTHVTVWNIEKRRVVPHPSTMTLLAVALGVEPEALGVDPKVLFPSTP